MVKKHLICPERVRKVPKHFSWVDHRLVREGHIDSLSHQAATLYLFLITVGDDKGLSYYSDASIEKRLSMDNASLRTARENLIRNGLISYKNPLYQVLSLDSVPKTTAKRGAGQPLSLKEIFKQATGGDP